MQEPVLPLDALIRTWTIACGSKGLRKAGNNFFRPPLFHINLSTRGIGSFYAGFDPSSEQHVLLTDIHMADQIRNSLIQHLSQSADAWLDSSSAPLRQQQQQQQQQQQRWQGQGQGQWHRQQQHQHQRSCLHVPIDSLWRHPASVALHVCWLMGVFAVALNLCAAAYLLQRWRLLTSPQPPHSRRRPRVLGWLAVGCGWLVWLTPKLIRPKRWRWLPGWQPGLLRMHWLLHYHILRTHQPEADEREHLQQLHALGLTPQHHCEAMRNTSQLNGPDVQPQPQQQQQQQQPPLRQRGEQFVSSGQQMAEDGPVHPQISKEELEVLLLDPQLVQGGVLLQHRYDNVTPVAFPDAVAYKNLMMEFDRHKRAKKQAASLAAARELLDFAKALVNGINVGADGVFHAAAATNPALPLQPPLTLPLQQQQQQQQQQQEREHPQEQRLQTAGLPAAARASHRGPALLLSIDLEWWERSAEQLLEIGWTLWDCESRSCTSKHWIVSEGLPYANGRYVPNMRHAFKFGASVAGLLQEGIAALQADIDAHPGLVLVGHDMGQDLDLLAKWGVRVPEGTLTLDTAKLAWASIGNASQQPLSLRAMLAYLQVPGVSGLHNGGNDARYTMEALLRLCATDALCLPVPPASAAPSMQRRSPVSLPHGATPRQRADGSASCQTATPRQRADGSASCQSATGPDSRIAAPPIAPSSSPVSLGDTAAVAEQGRGCGSVVPSDGVSQGKGDVAIELSSKGVVVDGGAEEGPAREDSSSCQTVPVGLRSRMVGTDCGADETASTSVSGTGALAAAAVAAVTGAAAAAAGIKGLEMGAEATMAAHGGSAWSAQGAPQPSINAVGIKVATGAHDSSKLREQQQQQQQQQQALCVPVTNQAGVSTPTPTPSQQSLPWNLKPSASNAHAHPPPTDGCTKHQQQQLSVPQAPCLPDAAAQHDGESPQQALHHLTELQQQNPRLLNSQLTFRCIPVDHEPPSFIPDQQQGNQDKEAEIERDPGDKLRRQSAFACHLATEH